MPGTPIVGQSPIASNGAVHLSGTGAPEGVVPAAPGSTWLQIDASNDVKGWIRWVKATGTWDTGWIAGPEADTGWRNVTCENAVWDQAFKFRIRRKDSRVVVQARLGSTSGGVWAGLLYTLPAGFRASEYMAYSPALISFYNTGEKCTVAFDTTGSLSTLGLIPTNGATAPSTSQPLYLNGETSWTTNDPWPSSLPGSAA